ncbi:hypothetical protein [Asticcacaulis solisilvae]|uniref:hypothetical protein n=1 Tax=Asticcacaulis solisilvae TaxID=1217274 RepID=UPI003FD7397D
MTKQRHPMTAYRALARIAGEIGWDGAAAVLKKSESTIRKYADPDTEREISLQDAMRLDLAFRRAGGDGAPLYEAYTARLELDQVEDDDSPENLVRVTRTALRESTEAVEAALDLAGGAGDRKGAIRECNEAIEALTTLKFRLTNKGGRK